MLALYIIACSLLLAGLGIHWLRPPSSKRQSHSRICRTEPAGGYVDNSLPPKALGTWKDLYNKLQNLEDHPGVIPSARHTLLSFLREGILIEKYKSPRRSILQIDTWDDKALDDFLAAEAQDVFEQWKSYTERRAAGSPPELFRDREHAREWLLNYAPLNLIDGAWLCHVHKITTPFNLRNITKHVWQNLSEELGDGDLQKNHIYLYRELLRSVGFQLPPSYDLDFLRETNAMDDPHIWKAALGQLLISLVPNDFLPEILGFNLHFERLSTQTLKASKELPEFGISGQYYLLHISIDNGHSGHSAMAAAIVKQYLTHISKTRPEDVPVVWKRVQAGYLLSQNLDAKETVQSFEDKVADIISNKARLSQHIHCASRVRIGKQSLADWLAVHTEHGEVGWSAMFLDALAGASPLITRGDSGKSRLIRELSWSGRMFGAFTTSEMGLIRTWIDALPPDGVADHACYWSMIGLQSDPGQTVNDITTDHPVHASNRNVLLAVSVDQAFVARAPLEPTTDKVESLLPLWFTHCSILENIINSPYRTVEQLNSHIVRILHAEMGYQEDPSGVAGMDELSRDSHDLVSIGVQIMLQHKVQAPTCLKDVLEGARYKAPRAHEFSLKLLRWSMQPIRYESFLLGLARAFLDLELAVLARSDVLRSSSIRLALQQIVARKQQYLKDSLEEVKSNRNQYSEFIHGYILGRDGIQASLE